MKPKNSEKGSALMVTVGLILLISLLGLSAFRLGMTELQMASNGPAAAEARYLAESGIALVLQWFQSPGEFPDIGSYPNRFPASDYSHFLRKRRSDARGAPSFLDDRGVSQFGGTSVKPDFMYEFHSGGRGLLGPVTEKLGNLTGLKIYGPEVPGGVCTLEATGSAGSGMARTVSVQIMPSPLSSVLSAVQTSNGVGHPVPILVHWGDVRISGNADLGADLDAIPVKESGAGILGTIYGATGRKDAWADYYIGEALVLPSSPGCIGCTQPFLSGGHPNIYQYQSGIPSGFQPDSWDYRALKALAKERGTYYGTDRTGALYVDGVKDASHRRMNSEFLGGWDPDSNREFVFIDTVDGNAPDGSNLAELDWPVDYLKGFVFAFADLTLRESGPGRDRTVWSPPLEGTADPSTRMPVRLSGIHVDGVLFSSGRISVEGHPKIFGVLSAKNGFGGSGQPEIWYDGELLYGNYPGLPVVMIQKGSWKFR